MARGILAVGLVGVALAGCGTREPRGIHELSYHQLREVERIVEIPEGYALLGRQGLVGYDHEDQRSWTVEPSGRPLDLAALSEDTLAVAWADDGGIRLDRVGVDGTTLSSVLATGPMGPLEDARAVLRPDGGAWVRGREAFPWSWHGSVEPDGTMAIGRFDQLSQNDVVATGDGDALVLQTSWTNDTATDLTISLLRVDGRGEAQSSTVVVDPSTVDGVEIGDAVRRDGFGGAYVFTARLGSSSGADEVVIRRYDADGSLRSTVAEPRRNGGAVFDTIVAPSGDALWLDVVDPGSIRLRVTDEDGEVSDEALFDWDGTPLMDAIFIDDVLHVLTEDGLLRISLG